MRKIAMLLAAMLASAITLANAADTVKKELVTQDRAILDRLYATTGVYNKSAAATMPGFVSYPGWPAPLPHSWMLGQIGGLYVDQHDYILIYNRPPTMTTEEALLETRGGADGKKGMGFARPMPALA